MNVCVFGASSDNIDLLYFEEVKKLGRKLAENSHAIVFGGGAHGLMGAVARGAAEKGGKIIGIAPSFFDVGDILYKDSGELIFDGKNIVKYCLCLLGYSLRFCKI